MHIDRGKPRRNDIVDWEGSFVSHSRCSCTLFFFCLCSFCFSLSPSLRLSVLRRGRLLARTLHYCHTASYGNYSVCLHLLMLSFLVNDSEIVITIQFDSMFFFSVLSVCFHCTGFTSKESRNKSMRSNDRKQIVWARARLFFSTTAAADAIAEWNQIPAKAYWSISRHPTNVSIALLLLSTSSSQMHVYQMHSH